MFKKIGYSPSPITQLSKDAVLADPVIVERMTKLAHEIKSLAAKSDDFLYFSIIFLKSAESALLDETGNLKKVGNDRAGSGMETSSHTKITMVISFQK